MSTSTSPAVGRLADAWVSFAVGAVLLFAFPRIVNYYLIPSSFTWTFVDRSGAPLAYTASAFFQVDVGVALLAIASLVDGLSWLVRARPFVAGALAVSAVAALANAFVALSVSGELGFQVLPAIGIAGSGWLALQQLGRFRRPTPA